MRLRHAFRLFAVAALLLSGSAVSAADASDAPRADLTLEHVDDVAKPFTLSAPRPNPFRSTSELTLTVETASEITVTVHDALGRQVALLREGTTPAGTYRLRVEAGTLPPGLYIVRATSDRGDTATRSLSLVR